MLETKHYADGTSATGIAPLPVLSPDQQDIRNALTLARKFVEWPSGAAKMTDTLTAIDRALAASTLASTA